LVLFAFPLRHIPVCAIVYPGKADAAGWVGFFGEKGWNLLVGMGNDFAGANNMGDFRAAFANASIVHLMLVSWAVLAIALAASLVTLIRKPATSGLPLLAIFGIALFVIGEAEALYAQPQDPQLQIEPMFAIIPGIILLLGQGSPFAGSRWRPGLAGALAVVAVVNGAATVHLMQGQRGLDSKEISTIGEMDRLFPRDTTVIVWHGFEGVNTWQHVLLWRNNTEGFLNATVHLARPFTTNRGITGQQAAAVTTEQIDAHIANGQRVVGASIWMRPVEEWVGAFTTITTEAEARTYVSLVKNHYRIGAHWDTQAGPFVEILPVEAHAGDRQP